MKQKWTAIAAASVLTFALSTQAMAATSSFTDLNNVEGKDKIESLQERGYISGVTATQFKPNQTITSSQGVQLLVNSFNLSLDDYKFIKAPKASDSYTKVKDGVWYSDAFIVAAVNGLDVPRSVDPSSKLTREQFTNFTIAAMQKAGNLPQINVKPVTIKDESKITADYQGAIQRSLAWDVTELDDSGNFDPKQPITRAEAAVMIYNALQYLQEHPELSNQATDNTGMTPSDDAVEGES